MALSQFDENKFKDVIVGRVDLDEDTQDKLGLWWQLNGKVEKYLRRLELATQNCQSKPEKGVGRKLAREMRKIFNQTNLLYSKLLDLKTNFFMELWYWPIVTFFKLRPEQVVIDKIIEGINAFGDVFDGNKDDQILAVLEVLANTPFTEIQKVKERILEWSCEEFLRLYGQAKYNYLAGVDLGTTVDELEVEKQELREAAVSNPWGHNEKQKIHRKLKRIRYAMDLFEVETQAKRDLNDLIRYLTDGLPELTSITVALKNTEDIFTSLTSDSTQQAFWDWEDRDNDED